MGNFETIKVAKKNQQKACELHEHDEVKINKRLKLKVDAREIHYILFYEMIAFYNERKLLSFGIMINISDLNLQTAS